MRNVRPLLFSRMLTYYAYGLSLLAGVFLAADCLSEGEAGKARSVCCYLTDLRGYDVVLGKLLAVGLNALYGLVAVLPVTALPLLMGGVTGGEYWRVALALVNTLFFSLACGILVSTLSREAGRAIGNTLGLLVIGAVGLPMLGRALMVAGVPAGWSYLISISPFEAFGLGRAAGYGILPASIGYRFLSFAHIRLAAAVDRQLAIAACLAGQAHSATVIALRKEAFPDRFAAPPGQAPAVAMH